MSTGDLVLFEEFIREKGEAIHNFSSNTFKLGIVVAAAAPAADDATPRWGDYSANEVATGATYSAGGPSLTTVTWLETAGVAAMDADDVEIGQDPTGFTNGRYGILYNDTDASKRAFGFVDLGSDRSIQTVPLLIRWNAAGIWKDTASNP